MERRARPARAGHALAAICAAVLTSACVTDSEPIDDDDGARPEIDAHQRLLHRRHHATIELVTGLVDARCINKHHLTLRPGDYPLNPKPRGLWFIGNGSDLLAHQSIEQRRLAGIRAANQCDISAIHP